MPRAKDLPPSSKEWRFINAYVDCRDLNKAALKAGYDGDEGERLYRLKRVRLAIDHAIDLYDRERAKLAAKASVLHVDFLDSELVKAVKAKASQAKNRAIELAYERIGLRRDGDFIIPASADNTAPSMYQALIERQTVKTEVTVERQVSAISAPAPTPALPPAKPAFEIIDL